MEKNLLVSIITPCHNASAHIADAIESVLSQTYSNWEMIICDDCSTDNSVEIIESYAAKDSRIKLYKNGNSIKMPSKPRNIAIAAAEGDVIAFLDSDDMWLPSKLEKQLPLLNDKNTAVVYSYYEKINVNGERDNRIIKSPTCTDFNQMLKSNVIGNLTGMYDVRKVGKVYNRNIHHEDYILWLDILKKGFIAKNTQTVEALYRVGQQSASSNKFKTLLWHWNIIYNIEKVPFFKAIGCIVSYAYNGFKKNRI